MRIHGPYITISQALTMGLAICAAKDPDDVINRRAGINCDPETLDRYVELARWLLEMAPFLHEFLPSLDEDREAVMLLSQFVDYHARQGRSTDISTLKANISSWILAVRVQIPPSQDSEGEPIAGVDYVYITNKPDGTFDANRANWGWNSSWSARLLVWGTARHEFDKNLNDFLQGLCNGNIKMNEMGFPSFLYGDGTRPISSDAKDFLDGLCEGDLLMSGYRCVWTSPGSALLPAGATSGGRASISRTHGINRVQGGSIAYIAVLMRHILSSEVDWNHQSFKTFNGEAFFHRIVQLFKRARFATPVLARFQK
ncbi:hypothetical protein C2E23DRAFT_789380 [Lenzites betulinus]|nr:hypothetical protein C2E23DRAFT_789380 [Lenzites betulinus]